MLSRLAITFLPRSKRLLFPWLQSPSAVILKPKKIKSVIFSIAYPCICHKVMGPDVITLVFWMLSFKSTFSLSPITFINSHFSSSSLSATRVVSSAYLRLLIFLQAILIPACASSSPAFLMMYSAYELNKQGYHIQPWRTPFPIWNKSVPYSVLTVASWPSYRFLRRQVRWSLLSYYKNYSKNIFLLYHYSKNIKPATSSMNYIKVAFLDTTEFHMVRKNSRMKSIMRSSTWGLPLKKQKTTEL